MIRIALAIMLTLSITSASAHPNHTCHSHGVAHHCK